MLKDSPAPDYLGPPGDDPADFLGDIPEFLRREPHRKDGMTQIEFHQLAEIFPLIEGKDFADLVDDIRQNGLHEPIVLYQDRILDGRNRHRACLSAGIEPTFTEYTGSDPLGYVISLNLKRRHLSESQRAMVAAKLATIGHGGDRSKSPVGDLTQQQAADLLNVGKRSVERATEVRGHGAPELQQAVERGEVSVSAAADVATLPHEEQVEIVARGEREILKAASEIRARKAAERHTERIRKLAEICINDSPLPTATRYPILLADPPWAFKVYDEQSGSARAAGSHYPTMELSEICRLPVTEVATDDAVLFLWTTAPHLLESIEVLKAWGFEYVSNVVWVKDKVGLGYWVRNQHELLLIARRGDVPTPLPANRPPSIIQAPRREHSQKPDEAYELIERMYPDLRKIELFARQARAGWAAWGNQVPVVDAA